MFCELDVLRVVDRNFGIIQWRFHAGPGAQPPPNRDQAPNLAGPKFRRTLDTLWPTDSRKN